MDAGNKVMCAPYVAVTSDQLSPTQRLVAEALTEQGLSVDTACVYSLKSSLVEPPRQRMYSINNTTLNLLFFPAAFHCDDKASLVQPYVEVVVPKEQQGKQQKQKPQGGGVEANRGGVEHYRGKGPKALEDGEQDSTPSFVFTIFVPLTPCHLWIGRKTSTSFAVKIEQRGKNEFFADEIECFHMYPSNLYMFSGAFPHAGGNYSELNVREFFRVYTSDRQGSNQDQHYFEVRK